MVPIGCGLLVVIYNSSCSVSGTQGDHWSYFAQTSCSLPYFDSFLLFALNLLCLMESCDYMQ